MLRRDLLRSLGASMALAMVPREAAAVWERVAQVGRPMGAFNARHLALVEAVAESIIPATDTPGANDVNVAAFVDVIVNENYGDDERAALTDALRRAGYDEAAGGDDGLPAGGVLAAIRTLWAQSR